MAASLRISRQPITKYICLLLCLITGIPPGRAQELPVRYERLGPPEGLTHSTVRKTYQDRHGFIWIATRDGLNRYDGQSFRTFRHRHGEPNSLRGGDVVALGEDSKGQLWVGTYSKGLQRLNPDGSTFTHIERTTDGTDVSKWSISCLATDRRGHVWAGTLGSGWLIVDPNGKEIRQYTLPKSVGAVNAVTCGMTARDGSLWFGMEDGLVVRFNAAGQLVGSYELPQAARQSLLPKKITALWESQSGMVLLASRNQGLYAIHAKTGELSKIYGAVNSERSDNIVTAVTEDKQNRIWVGTDDGIRRFPLDEPNKVQVLRPEPNNESSLSSHAVQSLLTDRWGNVWVGTWEGGLNVWYADQPRLEVISQRPLGPRRLTMPKVSAVTTDPVGNIWVGSVSGLLRLPNDDQPVETIPIPARFRTRDVYRMITDGSGHVYVSFWDGGVGVYDRRMGLTPLMLPPSDRHVNAFAHQQKGGIWMIGSGQRLFAFHPQGNRLDTLGRIDRILQMPTYITYTCLWEDRHGQLWFGTYDHGLIVWDRKTGKVSHITAENSNLSENHITCLFEDSAGDLWVGTNGSGINRRRSGKRTFKTYTKQNGLSGDMIAAVEEDRYGNLWISTTEGLTRLNRLSGKMSVYGETDGLPTREFVSPGSAKLPNGDIAFASTQGLVLVHPDQFSKPLPPPRAYLANLLLFNKPVKAGTPGSPLQVELARTSELTLTPGQTVFTLEFGALCWGQNRHVRYAYKLDEFDPEWRYTDSEKNTTYTNLSPGTYRFRLRAARTGQPWGPEQHLLITVQPPWFKTPWALVLYVAILAGILLLVRHIIRIREKLRADVKIQEMRSQAIRQLDEAKTGFFTNVSHEFKTPLTLILTPLEKLLTEELPSTERLKEQFGVMHRNANRLLRLINQLLDLSRLENGALQPQIRLNNLLQHFETIVRSFDEVARTKGIQIDHELDPALQRVWSDQDFLEKIVTNLLSNAVKHTPEGGQISLKCQLQHGQLYLNVTDTGIGMSPAEQAHIFERFYQGQNGKSTGTGIGLSLTRELVELLGGSIEVESTPGSGSSFSICLPVRAEDFDSAWLVDHDRNAPTLPIDEMVPVSSLGEPNENARVLLIAEDDPELNAYLTGLFADSFQVLSAENGDHALQLARQHIPDAVITDWIMPGLEGPELCRLLKSDEKTSHIPVILLTSKASMDSQLAGLDVGADDYVTKPFSAALLKGRLQGLLANRQRLRQAFGQDVWLRPADVQLSNVDEAFLARATACIEEHIDDANFDVEQLQDALNMSQMQLYRKLKSLTNLAGRDFIRYIRLQRAAQLLETGQVTVSEAGYRVGFNDRSYFSRAFKKQFGHSPTEHLSERNRA